MSSSAISRKRGGAKLPRTPQNKRRKIELENDDEKLQNSNEKKKKSTRKQTPTKKSRTHFDFNDPKHSELVSVSLSDDDSSWRKPESLQAKKISEKESSQVVENKRKRKKRDLSEKRQGKNNNLKSKLSKFQGSTILFGDDSDIDPSELDEHGNIKDLIDYSDPEDYAVYENEMKKRKKREQKMTKRAHIIFSEYGGESGDEKEQKIFKRKKEISGTDSESEDEDWEEDSEDATEDETQQTMGILIPYLLGGNGQSENDSLTQFQERVIKSNLSDSCKQTVLKRLENADPDKPKLIEWVETLLNIPFGKLAISPVTINDPMPKIRGFFDETIKQFNKNVYGLENVKQQIVDYLGQFITAGPGARPRTLALCGGPGIGKTFLIRHGIADALGRPLRVVNMGGIKDSAHMCGFEYSYANARHGLIVQILIEKQIMNPIILFEEVDKISETRDGQDIQNILMHLTDPEQNKAFQDKYFSGIDIDISKAILVFTLNDPSALSPILLNRLHLVNVPDPSREDRIQIAKKHMIPEIFGNVNMSPDSVSISNEVCGYILDRYSQNDKGLRTFKACLETIMLRLNMIRLIGHDLSGKLRLQFPLNLSIEIIDSILRIPDHSSHSFLYL